MHRNSSKESRHKPVDPPECIPERLPHKQASVRSSLALRKSLVSFALLMVGMLITSRNLGQVRESLVTSTSEMSLSFALPAWAKTEVTCARKEFSKRSLQDHKQVFETRWKKTLTFVKKKKLSFLTQEVFNLHRDRLGEVEQNGVPGMIIECGVAKAGSSMLLAALKDQDRCLHLFDTFEGMPKPSAEDGADVHARYKKIQADKQKCADGKGKCNKSYYGNMDDLLGFVETKFQEAGFEPGAHQVSFHKGLFDDTVWPASPIAFAHLDGDWYESTFNMLRRIAPWMSVGGYVILDDAFHYSGARNALIDFFQIDMKKIMSAESTARECWTTSIDHATDGHKKYRLILETRAQAQVIVSDDSYNENQTFGDLPKCPFLNRQDAD